MEDARSFARDVLTGERVRLRGLRDGDLPSLVGWYNDPAFDITDTGFVMPKSEAARRNQMADWTANQRDDVGFVIETLDDPPVVIGQLGLWGARPKDRCGTLGIGIGLEHTGRGYGTDAVRVLVGYGFREFGLHRIQLTLAAFNVAGLRAYAKVGFVEEGRRRSAVFHDGHWYDEILMSILHDEWADSRS